MCKYFSIIPILVSSFVSIITGCHTVMPYPKEWAKPVFLETNDCPEISGKYSNIGRTSGGGIVYLFNDINGGISTILDRRRCDICKVEMKWIDNNNKDSLSIILFDDENHQQENVILYRSKEDFACIDGALSIKYVTGREIGLSGIIQFGERKYHLTTDGDLVREDNYEAATHSVVVLPLYFSVVDHAIWLKEPRRSRPYTFVELDQLVEISAHRDNLIARFGTPMIKHDAHTSYIACQASDEVHFVLNNILEETHHEKHILPECFELVFEFDSERHLIGYKKAPISAFSYKTPEEIKVNTIHLMEDEGIPESPWKLYAEGGRRPEDIFWLCEAADIGHTYAQLELGRIFWNRTDISNNRSKSYMWYILAAFSNINNGMYRDESIQRRAQREAAYYKRDKVLTEEQLNSAMTMLLMWKPGQCKSDLITVTRVK